MEITIDWELDGLKENKVPLHNKVFKDLLSHASMTMS